MDTDTESGLDPLHVAYNRSQLSVIKAREALRGAERALRDAQESLTLVEHTANALIAMMQEKYA